MEQSPKTPNEVFSTPKSVADDSFSTPGHKPNLSSHVLSLVETLKSVEVGITEHGSMHSVHSDGKGASPNATLYYSAYGSDTEANTPDHASEAYGSNKKQKDPDFGVEVDGLVEDHDSERESEAPAKEHSGSAGKSQAGSSTRSVLSRYKFGLEPEAPKLSVAVTKETKIPDSNKTKNLRPHVIDLVESLKYVGDDRYKKTPSPDGKLSLRVAEGSSEKSSNQARPSATTVRIIRTSAPTSPDSSAGTVESFKDFSRTGPNNKSGTSSMWKRIQAAGMEPDKAKSSLDYTPSKGQSDSFLAHSLHKMRLQTTSSRLTTPNSAPPTMPTPATDSSRIGSQSFPLEEAFPAHDTKQKLQNCIAAFFLTLPPSPEPAPAPSMSSQRSLMNLKRTPLARSVSKRGISPAAPVAKPSKGPTVAQLKEQLKNLKEKFGQITKTHLQASFKNRVASLAQEQGPYAVSRTSSTRTSREVLDSRAAKTAVARTLENKARNKPGEFLFSSQIGLSSRRGSKTENEIFRARSNLDIRSSSSRTLSFDRPEKVQTTKNQASAQVTASRRPPSATPIKSSNSSMAGRDSLRSKSMQVESTPRRSVYQAPSSASKTSATSRATDRNPLAQAKKSTGGRGLFF